MKYSPKDVAKLVADVELAFTAQLAKAKGSSLAKSEDGEVPFKDKEHEEKPEHKEASPAEGEEKPEASEHEGHEKPEHEAKEGHEDHGYDEEDMAHMDKMYRSMSPAEQKAHHGCLTKCMGGDGGMAKAEITSSEPKNTPGAKSPASAAHGDKLNKADGCGGEMSASAPKNTPGAKSPASKEQDGLGKEMAKTETGKIESSEPKITPGAKSPASKAEGVQWKNQKIQKSNFLKTNLQLKKLKKRRLKNF